MSVEKKNAFNILLNSSYWITKKVLALAKNLHLFASFTQNHGLSIGENYINIMDCRMFNKSYIQNFAGIYFSGHEKLQVSSIFT